jgi:hypothetical protein
MAENNREWRALANPRGKSRLEPVDDRVALLAGQRGEEELHDFGAGVYPGERPPISGMPRTQQ